VGERPGGEGEALDRLEADDAALEKTLEDARSVAALTVARARSAAAEEGAAARRALEVEVAAVAGAAARDAAEIRAGSVARASQGAASLARRAGARMDEAVELVLRAVTGEGP